MNRESGFNALPNELFLLIGDEISDDPRTLKALTLVSKRFHDSFNSFLYRDVANKALPTLARSRRPLTGAHPASFIKKFTVSPTRRRKSAIALQKQIDSVMKNIALYATNGAIQSFTFHSNFTLPQVLGGSVPPALKILEELILSCPMQMKSVDNTQLNVSLAKSLCGPSLITLELDFPYALNCPPDHLTLAKLIKQLPTSSPRLKRLSLRLPLSDQRSETLSNILNDSSFSFPALIEFAFEYADYKEKLSDSLKHFFRRHPMIEVLEYCVYTSTTSARPLATPGILPKLRRLEGFVEDGILVCNLGVSRLESLSLDWCLRLVAPCSERCAQIRDALSKTASIRQLYLREPEGYSLDNISSIISSCPNLTHLECWFDFASSKRCNIKPIYSTILGMLPHLAYLVLCMTIWKDFAPYSEGVHSGLSKEAWSILFGKEHREAIAALIPLTDRSANTLRVQVHDYENCRKKLSPFIEYSYTR